MFCSSDSSWTIGFFLLAASSFIVASNASIHPYRNEAFNVQLNARFFHGGTEGLYAPSFIRFDEVTFLRTVESTSKHKAMHSTKVEAIVLDVKDRGRIGGSFLNTEAVCCTPKLADAGSCSLGEVLINKSPEDPKWPIQVKTFFRGNETEANMSPDAVRINKTGIYYLYFIICDPELDGLVVQGRTIWKNPHGYLPGKMAPLMKFFGFVSLAYLVLGLAWFIRVFQYWKTIVQVQYYISVIITLGMSEMAIRYYEYASFNSTGMRPVEFTLLAVNVSSLRKTLERLLVLVVSMRGIPSRLSLLGGIFFVATEVLQLAEDLGNFNDFPRKTVTALAILVALLDACFIMWIFSSLAKTCEKLQIKRDMVKLQLYRNFTNALAIFILLSIAWIDFELYFTTMDPLSTLWRIAWIVPAFWHCLSYGMLVFVCVLWAPSNKLTRKRKSGEEEDLKESEDEGI